MTEKSRKLSQARDRILKTAQELFYQNGIRATGIDKVIKEAEVAKMTFYHHFPSKQKLVLEVLQKGEALWLEQFHIVVDNYDNPKERLLALFDFLKVWFLNPKFRGCAYINAIVEGTLEAPEERHFALKHKDYIKNFVIKHGLELGLDKKNALVLGEEFLLLFDGAIIRALQDKNDHPANNARNIAETILTKNLSDY